MPEQDPVCGSLPNEPGAERACRQPLVIYAVRGRGSSYLMESTTSPVGAVCRTPRMNLASADTMSRCNSPRKIYGSTNASAGKARSALVSSLTVIMGADCRLTLLCMDVLALARARWCPCSSRPVVESGRASFTYHAGVSWAYLVVAIFSLCILAL